MISRISELRNEQYTAVSANMWHVLVNKCGGESTRIARSAGNTNGFGAWRRFHGEHEGGQGNTPLAIRRFILNPAEIWANDKKKGKDCMESIVEWLRVVHDYREAGNEMFSYAICVYVFMEHLFEPYLAMSSNAPPSATGHAFAVCTRMRDKFAVSKKCVAFCWTDVLQTPQRQPALAPLPTSPGRTRTCRRGSCPWRPMQLRMPFPASSRARKAKESLTTEGYGRAKVGKSSAGLASHRGGKVGRMTATVASRRSTAAAPTGPRPEDMRQYPDRLREAPSISICRFGCS